MRTIFKYSLIYRQRRKIILSSLISILLCFIGYLVNNCPYPYFDNLDKYCWIEYIIRQVCPEKLNRDDAIFLNVAYDKQIASYEYDCGGLIGDVAITNRETLLRFLQIAESTNNYKCICLDINFEEGISTDIDSALFATINRMRNIYFSKHSDMVSIGENLSNKAAINDFYTTIVNTNFTRYPFIQNGEESLPVKIFSVTSKDYYPIHKHGLLYTSNGRLCQNSPFVRISEDFLAGHGSNGDVNYYDLGPNVLKFWEEDDWEIELKDKIVFVGDFNNDKHDTYCGMQPGSYLIYLAYKELMTGKQYVAWWFMLVSFCIYFTISIFILNNKVFWDYISLVKKITNPVIQFFINMLGYSTLLIATTIILYIVFKSTFNVFFASIVFSSITSIVKFRVNSK